MHKSLFIAALCAFTWVAQAQTTPNEKFLRAMEKALSGMDTLKTPEQWLSASNNFERIAQKEPKEWLPAYYVALSQTMIYNTSKESSQYEALAKKAEAYINKADSLQPDNSEVYVLRSMVSGLYIRLNPMANGMKYGPLAAMQLEKAKSLDPENPRVYMQEGITAYMTPAQWGGDKEKGKKLMEMAAAKFETFKPASPLHPRWGKNANTMFLEMAKKG
ncbi:MAG TPA: hypothetical protein PK971_12385 [Saprospiraceae bacterium]|nr:hypothetical protein [Saprospiraceae bacterium]